MADTEFTYDNEIDEETGRLNWSHCPECSIRGGITRQQAFDAFFATGRSADVQAQRRCLVRRAVKREFTGDRADPTAFATLSCGHTVMA